jgi:hypothetical protein
LTLRRGNEKLSALVLAQRSTGRLTGMSKLHSSAWVLGVAAPGTRLLCSPFVLSERPRGNARYGDALPQVKETRDKTRVPRPVVVSPREGAQAVGASRVTFHQRRDGWSSCGRVSLRP